MLRTRQPSHLVGRSSRIRPARSTAPDTPLVVLAPLVGLEHDVDRHDRTPKPASRCDGRCAAARRTYQWLPVGVRASWAMVLCDSRWTDLADGDRPMA